MSNLIKEEISRINELMGVHNKININEDRGDFVNALKTILGKTERELADEDVLRRALSDALNNPSIRKQITSVTYDVTKRVLGDSFTKIENKIYKDLLSGVPLKTVNTNMDNLINSMVASGSIKGLTPEMATALKTELKDRATKISKGKTAEEVFGRKISKPKSKSTSSSTDSASKVTKKLSPELEESLLALSGAIKQLDGFQKYIKEPLKSQLIKQYQSQLTDPKKFDEIWKRASKNIDELIIEANKRKDVRNAARLNKVKGLMTGTGKLLSKGYETKLGKVIFRFSIFAAFVAAAAYYYKDIVRFFVKSSSETGQVEKESKYMDIPGWDEVPQDAKDFLIREFEKPGTPFNSSNIQSFKVNDNKDNVTYIVKVSSGEEYIQSITKLPSGWKFDY
jgi:hypothetical protein